MPLKVVQALRFAMAFTALGPNCDRKSVSMFTLVQNTTEKKISGCEEDREKVVLCDSSNLKLDSHYDFGYLRRKMHNLGNNRP